jgi:hypothetical protein
MDQKDMLGSKLTDAGFDFSVRREFWARPADPEL